MHDPHGWSLDWAELSCGGAAAQRSPGNDVHIQGLLESGHAGRSRHNHRPAIVDSSNFPAAMAIAAALVEIDPGGIRELHWHPSADEWH
jgi:oxalate decarboxylase/phosphoglucose isomerase-like protein (cupin superfamily)